MTIAYQAALQAGNNLGNSFKQARESNVIETILSDAMSSGNPEDYQKSIGMILSKVSPEKQGAVMQALQLTTKNLAEKKEKQQRQQTLSGLGLDPSLPNNLLTEQYKGNQKNQRLSQFGLGASNQEATNQNMQPATQQGSVFRNMTDDDLVKATGHPDREASEPAKAELNRRQEAEKVKLKQNELVFKSGLKRSEKVLEEADKIAATLPLKESSLDLMQDAIANKNMSFFSGDNLAELSGIEGFRSKEGAVFKTAGKEFFLGNISRAGARPNQWIEQQIAEMMPRIGRDASANFSVVRALRNEIDLDKERVRLSNEISDRLSAEGDQSQAKLGYLVNKELSRYASQKQVELFNDLRAIKAIDEKKPQKFRPLEKNAPVSEYMAQALLLQFNNDPKKAAQEAKKLGYEF